MSKHTSNLKITPAKWLQEKEANEWKRQPVYFACHPKHHYTSEEYVPATCPTCGSNYQAIVPQAIWDSVVNSL